MTNTLFLTYSLLALLVLLTAAGGYPFTLLFARLGQSAAVRTTQKFNRINVLLSYAWAATLLIGAGVAWYASGGVWEHLAPLTTTLAIGITITIAGIKLLPQICQGAASQCNCSIRTVRCRTHRGLSYSERYPMPIRLRYVSGTDGNSEV